MKNTIKLLGIIALVAVIVFSMAACSKKSDSSSSETVVPTVEAVVLEPEADTDLDIVDDGDDGESVADDLAGAEE